MTLQIIKSTNGKNEYVLLPFYVYNAMRGEIDKKIKKIQADDDYLPFDAADYIDNPVVLARINAGITQKQLAKLMKVTQAYISKIEKQEKVTPKLLNKIKVALSKGAHK